MVIFAIRVLGGLRRKCRISAEELAAGEASRLRIRESFHKRGEYSRVRVRVNDALRALSVVGYRVAWSRSRSYRETTDQPTTDNDAKRPVIDFDHAAKPQSTDNRQRGAKRRSMETL
jgi:hypothetical protein